MAMSMSWSALCNTRRSNAGMGNALDAMMWRIVNGIPHWPTYDLFM
jgi:hypothetical protein